VTEIITTYAEALALLSIALGLGWIVAERFGIGYGLLVFGAVILCMSAGLAALRPRKGGVE
jgi:uncharacterized membrane protein YhfC